MELMAEYGVIGSIILDPSYLPKVRSAVTTEHFRTEQGRSVFRLVCQMADSGAPIDPMTVSGRSDVPQGWFVDVLDLLPTAHNCMAYVEQMQRDNQYAALRSLADDLASRSMLRKQSPAEIVGDSMAALERIGEHREAKTISNTDALMQFMAHRDNLQKGGSLTVSSGFPSIDKILGSGFIETGLYILAARPGVGKTSLGLMIADQVSKSRPVLFVSLEMETVEITARRVANISGCGIGRLLFGRNLREDMVQRASEATITLSARELTLNRAVSATVADIGLLARDCKAEFVVIDYLGLIATQGQYASEYVRVSQISRDLKQLARSLHVPILCLAQLNRLSEGRESKRPQLSDIRDSGAVEQDADGVLLIHRPAMYLYGSDKPADWDLQSFEVNVAKNRHGPTGTVVLQWIPYNGRFTDGSMHSWEDPEPPKVEALPDSTPVPEEFEQQEIMEMDGGTNNG